MTETTILNYWVNKELQVRNSQQRALEWIESLSDDIKYIFLELPVGAGKSDTGVTISSYLTRGRGNSYIFTPQKMLQRQYENSFDPGILASLYGRSNYECVEKNTNCDIGNSKNSNKKCLNCPATEAFNNAICSPNMVVNYALGLLLFKYLPESKVPKRKLIIFDECHTLENHLTEFDAVICSEKRCKKCDLHFYMAPNIDEAIEWILATYKPAVMKKFKEYCKQAEIIYDELEYEHRKLSKDEQRVLDNCKEFGKHLDVLNDLLAMDINEIKSKYVLVNENKSFKFKLLYGKDVFHSIVKPKAEKFLFMSATILNKDEFCRDLGLDPKESAFLSLESEFPSENRPIFFIPVMKMNYTWKDDINYSNRQDMLGKIKDLCDLHHDESGIIHTGNFQIAQWLVESLPLIIKHKILHHNPGANLNRDDVINEYLTNAPYFPTLLISPSITEGLDLKNELGRFAIFVKVPYPNLQDAFVKKRQSISNEWYSRQAMINIMQGAGRIVRHKEDYGYVYILDSSFGYLYNQMFYKIPDWWKESLQ